MSNQATKLKKVKKHLQAALKSLALKAKKRKRANPCKVKANPRVHFPKTRRGRPKEMKSWLMTVAKRPPVRFMATKEDAYEKARAHAKKHNKVILDGPNPKKRK